jgi:methionyl-tRNA formyltransferase
MVDRIVIIGTGRLAAACVQHCVEMAKPLVCLEPESRLFSPLSAVCRTHAVEYRLETDKRALAAFFTAIAVPTLIVSAYNGYLFPPPALHNENLTIVNFHNSLLPRHRGRNAPTWTIFELDEVGGVTWHTLGERIDSGHIVAQREVELDDRTTALELTERSLEAGAGLFAEILPRLLRRDVRESAAAAPTGTVRRATDMPNDGVLDCAWTVRKISAFLRSIDYGKLPVFPPAQVRLDDGPHEIRGYDVVADALATARVLERRGEHLTIRENGVRVDVALRSTGAHR